jgi:hypothetical protein
MSSSATHLHPNPNEYIVDLQQQTIHLMQPLITARAICKTIFDGNAIPNRSFVAYLDPQGNELVPSAIIKDITGQVWDAYNIPNLEDTTAPLDLAYLGARAVADVRWFTEEYHEYTLIPQEATTDKNLEAQLTYASELVQGISDAFKTYVKNEDGTLQLQDQQ